MAHIIPDSAVPSGWQCPACRHVYGPQVSECSRCPDSCCACGSPDVRYRNYRDQPFCTPCADGERPRGLRPDNVPILALPAEMGHAGYLRIARFTGDWTDIFPGFQARLTDSGLTQTDVQFRLTPPDGQHRD